MSESPRKSSSPVVRDTPTSTEPERLAPDELADYEQLRNLVSPEKSLALLDDFAKWLFAIAAVVGTLGTSFGVSNANDLTGAGRRLFAWAVACIGVSLALAALARLPVPRRVNRYSPPSLEAHTSFAVKLRGGLLLAAGVLFAGALILAGLSPLFS
jgi:hypothetical protein